MHLYMHLKLIIAIQEILAAEMDFKYPEELEY